MVNVEGAWLWGGNDGQKSNQYDMHYLHKEYIVTVSLGNAHVMLRLDYGG